MRLFRHLLLVLVLVACLHSPPPASACPLCNAASEADDGPDGDDPLKVARAYGKTIYLMAGMPYFLLTCFGTWAYFAVRSARKQDSSADDREPTDS